MNVIIKYKGVGQVPFGSKTFAQPLEANLPYLVSRGDVDVLTIGDNKEFFEEVRKSSEGVANSFSYIALLWREKVGPDMGQLHVEVENDGPENLAVSCDMHEKGEVLAAGEIGEYTADAYIEVRKVAVTPAEDTFELKE